MTENQIRNRENDLKALELEERARHNRAEELETKRSNLAEEAERHRSNIANEAGTYGIYGPGTSPESRAYSFDESHPFMDKLMGGFKGGAEWAAAINPFSFKIGL